MRGNDERSGGEFVFGEVISHNAWVAGWDGLSDATGSGEVENGYRRVPENLRRFRSDRARSSKRALLERYVRNSKRLAGVF